MLLANIVTDFTDWLEDVSGNWWFLIVIVVIAYLDSIIPAAPSETTVILGGIAAGFGTQELWQVIACGASGAFLGDNTAYLIGSRFSGWYERRAARRPKAAERLRWAREQIRSRGGLLLITARFVPGGRTVLTVSSGITRQPHGWFARWVAVAAIIWATYGSVLGRLFGEAFKDSHTTAFLLAFGAALSITAIIEVVRHQRAKRNARQAKSVPAEH
jgi:membrane protein DedA with SNARE-associated domain